MRKTMFATAALAALVGTATVAGAQSLPIPLSLEGRVDAAFPMGDFGDEADTGVGYGVSAALGVAPGFGVYGSYSHTRFGQGPGSTGTPDATDSGFSVGVTAAIPSGGMGMAPWVGGGLVFHQLQLGGNGSGIEEEMGFEVGGGVAVGVAPGVRLTPGVGYRRYAATVPVLGDVVQRDLTVQYLTLGVGLNIAF